jgi:hypothetical protein
MKRLAEIFAQERRKLEAQWDQREKVSTEDLRRASAGIVHFLAVYGHSSSTRLGGRFALAYLLALL